MASVVRSSPSRSSNTLCAALAASLLLLAGCASTRLDAQWVDPQLAGASLRGAKVLVACESYESVVKRICQDQLAAEVTARGATPVMAPEIANPAPGRPIPDEHFLPAARAAGAKAVLSSTITLSHVNDGGSGVSIGLGGFGIGGGRVGAGVGMSMPVGSATVSTSYSANSRITDAASGRLMWTAKATTPASKDVDAQLGELAKTTLGAAEKAGLF